MTKYISPVLAYVQDGDFEEGWWFGLRVKVLEDTKDEPLIVAGKEVVDRFIQSNHELPVKKTNVTIEFDKEGKWLVLRVDLPKDEESKPKDSISLYSTFTNYFRLYHQNAIKVARKENKTQNYKIFKTLAKTQQIDKVDVKETAKLLNVSEMTIRRYVRQYRDEELKEPRQTTYDRFVPIFEKDKEQTPNDLSKQLKISDTQVRRYIRRYHEEEQKDGKRQKLQH
jgi:hypothetical protein